MPKIERNPNDSRKTTAIVLAGGLSTRMGGRSKSNLLIDGIPMIEHIVRKLQGHFDQILISANPNQDFGFLENAQVVIDLEPELGPLMGLFTCLEASDSYINFVTTCDNPNPDINLIRKMIEIVGKHDAIVPKSPTGKVDPLFAVYKKSVAEKARKLLDKDIRKVMLLLENLDVTYLETNSESAIININNPGDYEIFISDKFS